MGQQGEHQHWHPDYIQAKDKDTPDFRDTQAIAHTLCVVLAAEGFKISIAKALN
jgi:hypothetical protein